MVKVEVLKENNIYKKVSIIGHAMYSDYGKDIICSAISSIVTTSINGILSLNKGSLNYEVNAGDVKIIINSDDFCTQTLIANMISLLKELEVNYPANIKVK